MRTTVTLDDDVVRLLESVEAQRKLTRKEVVNEALRDGLIAMTKPRVPQEPYRTPLLVKGPSALENMDNLDAVLRFGEGEDYK